MSDFRPLVMIPSYNTGPTLLLDTVSRALSSGVEILVVIDGSTDGSADALRTLAAGQGRALRILVKDRNTGKGDALRIAASGAIQDGYTHALCMDADGQHPADAIVEFLEASRKYPDSLIMGQPVFGEEAPLARVYGRKLTSFWTNLETLWCGLGDTLFGFRVYPLVPFLKAFEQTSFARGFDFDPEIAVRMAWSGCRPLQIPVRVRYLAQSEGGVSHFHYLRDNLKLTFLHFRLVPEFIFYRVFPFISIYKKWKSIY